MALEQWIIESPKTIDLEVVRKITANLLAGSVDIIAHDEPGCRVEVSYLSGHSLKVAIDGDTLRLDHPQLGWNDLPKSARTMLDQPSVRVSILVPAHCDVQVKATSANVLVMGVDGDISITTVGGEHFCDRTAGELHLSSAAGELSVRDHRGSIDARTATGDVTVTGPLERFSGHTVSGSTVLDVTGTPPSKIAVSSVSGSTTIRLPEATNPVCTLSTVTSKAQVGTKVVGPMLGQLYRVGKADDEGTPFTEVRVTTVGGRIVVLREGAPWPADEPEEGPSYSAYTSGRSEDAATSDERDASAPRPAASSETTEGAASDTASDGDSAGDPTRTAKEPPMTDQDAPKPTTEQRIAAAADRAAAVATEFVARVGEAVRAAKASWEASGPNPNVDLSSAPRPSKNFTSPGETASAPSSTTTPSGVDDPTETPTTASGSHDGGPAPRAAHDDDAPHAAPDVPFVAGATTTASDTSGDDAGFPPTEAPDTSGFETDHGAESVTGEGRDGLPGTGTTDSTDRSGQDQA